MRLLSVVLAGGAGSRLWPASRQAFPKSFMELGGSTLLQQAVERGQACGALDTMVVAHSDHQFLVKDVLRDTNSEGQTTLLLEPCNRNTAMAVAIAALQCEKQFGGDTLMLVLPAAHLIPNAKALAADIKRTLSLAEQGALVTFAVNPSNPATFRTYLEVAQLSRQVQRGRLLAQVPTPQVAQTYLTTGRHYWGTGIYLFTAQAIIAAYAAHAAGLLAAARHATATSRAVNGAVLHERATFESAPEMDFEQAVVGHIEDLQVVPADFAWSDVDSWSSVADAQTPDSSGNAMPPDAVVIDAQNTYVRIDSHTPKVVAALGLQDLVIVDTPDALLVAHKDYTHDLSKIVATLKARSHEAVNLPAVVRRPWGTYASLKEESGYKVKRITVEPGESLSLQYHHQRAEHWIVVQGTAKVQVGDVEYETRPGQYRYIPLAERHRLTNIGVEQLVLIEVQCGSYLGEDDIVRLSDTYGRV